jgi:polysaccharide biosynthesis protein PslG
MKRIYRQSCILAAFFCSILLQVSCSTSYPVNQSEVNIAEPLGLCHAGQTRTDREYHLLDKIGCEWLRVDYHWSSIEKSPGVFDFTAMDDFTKDALLHNKKIIAVLCYDVGWIHNDNNTHEYVPPEKYKSYIKFVTETVKRYKDKVAAFEIWNEPNLQTDRFWKGSDEEFINLFGETVEAIKHIDQSTIVTTPGLFLGDDKYLDKMFKAGVMVNVDVISFHPYSVSLNGYHKQIKRMIDKANEYNFKGEIWISEMGYPTGGLYPTRISERRLPEKIVKTIIYGLSENIKVITWYHLFDPEKRKWFDSEDFFGLVNSKNSYDPKNGIYAYRAIAKNISNSKLANTNVQCTDKNIIFYNFEKQDGNGMLVLWSKNNHHKTNITIPSSSVKQWSISSPDIISLSRSSKEMFIGKEPVILTYTCNKNSQDKIIINN